MRDLRAEHGDNIAVLTPDPEHTAIALPGERLVAYRMAPEKGRFDLVFWRTADSTLYRALLRLLQCRPGIVPTPTWVRTLLSGSRLHLVGGGYLTDLFDLEYFLRPVFLAKALGLPVTTSPLGLGPFASPDSARAVTRALRGVRVRVRDQPSLSFCHSSGLLADKRPDDGLRLREVLEQTPPLPLSTAPPQRIGVCVFGQYSQRWSKRFELWWSDCLGSVASAFPGHQIDGFCFHTDASMEFNLMRRLFRSAGLSPDNVHPPEPDYRKAITLVRGFRAIVSTRFHAVVTASVFKIPCVAVASDQYYETKMQSAVTRADASLLVLDPVETRTDEVARRLRRVLSGEPQRNHLSA